MRRRNLMKSRVYRRDSNGKRISSTYNQKEKKSSTSLKNKDMCSELRNVNTSFADAKKVKIFNFSLDIKSCNLYEVLDDIPINTQIGSYGRLQDIYIKRLYYKGGSDGTDERDCLDGLTDIEQLTYTRWSELYFVVSGEISNASITNVNIDEHELIYVENEIKSKCCKNSTKAKYRLPIRGYRKALVKCADTYNDGKNIYMDNYAKSKHGSGCSYDASGNVL